MTLLVCTVLILVTAGIVFFINYMNWRNIVTQAESALETLADNHGRRPEMPLQEDQYKNPGDPGEKQDDRDGKTEGRRQDFFARWGMDGDPGQPPFIREELASLSNYYVISLNEDGSVESWTSDRSYLYSEAQIEEIAAGVLAKGNESGHIGSQFYRIVHEEDNSLLIVLDERMELQTAERVLRTSSLIAAIACVLLCAAAYFLIRFMVKPIQDAFDRQRQFVSDASHELKTPLAVIGANAQALQGEIGENESLTFIIHEVQRTDRMIRNLLTLARTDQEHERASLREVDLGNAVLGAALPLEAAAFDDGKTIAYDISEHVMCKGDEDMLSQLTVILLNNALKYSDEGSEIGIEVSEKGRTAVLKVSNQGAEIPPSDMEHIFERFYRADASHSREVEGHGLGLAIAKNITDLHGGKIRVSCEPMEGGRFRTAFTVSLQGAS